MRRTGVLVLAALAVGVAGASARGLDLEFERFNATYEDPVPRVPPVRRGGLTIQLASARQTFTLHSNRLRLEPVGDGTHRGTLTLSFGGEADLTADVGVAGVGTRLEDRVRVPRQSRSLEGRLRLEEVADGFLVTPVELPERFEVAIESEMARELVGWCDQLTLLAFALPDCRVLERDLSKIDVPLPPPGRTFRLEASELTPAERKALSRYLKRSGP